MRKRDSRALVFALFLSEGFVLFCFFGCTESSLLDAGFLLVAACRDYSLVAVRRFLVICVDFSVSEHRPGAAPVVVA